MEKLPFPNVFDQSPVGEHSAEKAADLGSMLKFMDDTDVHYFKTIIKEKSEHKKSPGCLKYGKHKSQKKGSMGSSTPPMKKVKRGAQN